MNHFHSTTIELQILVTFLHTFGHSFSVDTWGVFLRLSKIHRTKYYVLAVSSLFGFSTIGTIATSTTCPV